MCNENVAGLDIEYNSFSGPKNYNIINVDFLAQLGFHDSKWCTKKLGVSGILEFRQLGKANPGSGIQVISNPGKPI